MKMTVELPISKNMALQILIINKTFVLQVWQQLLSLYFGWRLSLNGIQSLFAVLVPFLEWYLAWMFLTIYLIHLPKNWALFASGSVLPLLCFFSTGTILIRHNQTCCQFEYSIQEIIAIWVSSKQPCCRQITFNLFTTSEPPKYSNSQNLCFDSF